MVTELYRCGVMCAFLFSQPRLLLLDCGDTHDLQKRQERDVLPCTGRFLIHPDQIYLFLNIHLVDYADRHGPILSRISTLTYTTGDLILVQSIHKT